MTAREPIFRIPIDSLRRRMAPLVLGLLLASATSASALSEIKPDENAPPASSDEIQSVPLPPPVGTPSSPEAVPTEDDASPPAGDDEEAVPLEDDSSPAGDESIQTDLPKPDPNAPLPEVAYDVSKLPESVRRMRELLVEAAKSGDIEKLRPLIGMGTGATQLSFGDTPSDPIAFLKGVSGDDQGHEILAILEEVLQAGYVHLDAGEPEELYVWPYFFAVPLDRLTAPQRVELFRLVTAGDYEEMKAYGAYIFYRIGIAPDGRWAFFVAGD